ncbi:Wzz/FepE/Etk N-terminal domain-containing protein [Nocardioides sp. SYSU D00065]|uniref:Wzz/FepE/Etk N-terminal domain-containing protein n=1 Tax=Nocardioides sp. SYSU D00065 TaxID=2817378 RepID=UPI001B31E570|nr:Wzz/FepE/Etk N-terminal domain-containing protein [Nocardioides sp. SYSU D00065]
MPHDTHAAAPGGKLARAARHHIVLVAVLTALGLGAGWYVAGAQPATYTSTTRVLINPSVGNPFSATPASVRQDEVTSLETEAQMVRSAEVLAAVVERGDGLTVEGLASRLQVSVPPSTQILEITYSAGDASFARQVAGAVATAYLDNRDARFQRIQDERVGRLETQTVRTVEDLRAATSAAQRGTPAQRAFNNELADALRNELVNLRAQRTSLENLTSPPGTVIAPASVPAGPPLLTTLVWPVGGALAGLALGLLLAVVLERTRGVVRSAREAQDVGVPVVAAVPAAGWRDRRRPDSRREAVDAAVRRLRTTILDLDDRPGVITVTGTTSDTSDAGAAEALAGSFTRAGHRVVLVRPGHAPGAEDLAVDERGLAQLLLHERLDVHDVLRPSVEPLLSVLDGGAWTAETRELLTADRVREVLQPLVDEGNIVVIEAPGRGTADGEAHLAAADLGVVVVTRSRTRRRALEEVVGEARASLSSVVALVVGPRDLAQRSRPSRHADSTPTATGRDARRNARRDTSHGAPRARA